MAIQPVQLNVDNTKSQQPSKPKRVVKPYLEAEGAIATDNLVKPLPPKGHLIKNDLKNGVKYFFNDIAYDMKSIKNGFNGTANDHQLGRLNDVGLKVGGLGIATYLAANTSNPKARIMEYVGLGAFLTSMDLYPKLAIYGPARLKHGFNVGKEYIDDQGRKKSVLQDGNYIPFDMFRGDVKDEDLSKIADKMGIPKDAKNRNEIAKEHIRKAAIQNQTLWMLTAGVTPLMTALICCGLENYVVGPALEAHQNEKSRRMISNVLKETSAMSEELSADYSNKLSKDVSKFLELYKGKELAKEELNQLLDMFTAELDNEAATGVRADIQKLLRQERTGTDFFVVDGKSIEDAITSMSEGISARQRNKLKDIIVPTTEEFETIIKEVSPEANLENGVTLSQEDLESVKEKLKKLIDQKAENYKGNKAFVSQAKTVACDNAHKSLNKVVSYQINDETLKKLVDFSKVIGDFNEMNQKLLNCESCKFEFAPETVLARHYEKFERTFIKELGFTTEELKLLRESEESAAQKIQEKLVELAKDETRYKEVMTKFSKIISDMERSLHGSTQNESVIKDLVTAFENNYNIAAKRLNNLGAEDFATSIRKLVAQDPATLGNSLNSVEDVYAWLDGVDESVVKELDKEKAKFKSEQEWWQNGAELRKKYAIEHSNGVGSSKKLVLDRIRARYGGVKNSFNRVIHLMDFTKRGLDIENLAKDINIASNKTEYLQEIYNKGFKALLKGYTADFILKNETTNNPELYKDFMNIVYSNSNDIKASGNMTQATKDSLANAKEAIGGSVLERFGRYLTRFRNLLGNDQTDFLSPKHVFDTSVKNSYHKDAINNESRFNLVAKRPLDMVREGSEKKYVSKKWVTKVSSVAGVVFGVTLLSQLAFGKLRNPHKIEKQVKNESN